MKVILRSDVENLGQLGDVVDVRPGYGRNYLLPQGHAMLATPSNLKVFELERKKLQERVEALRGAASVMADRINKAEVIIPMRVGENDKLYGSVTTALIVEALEEKGFEIDRRMVLLDSPIRSLGEHIIRIRIHAGIMAELPLQVVSDRPVTEEEKEAKEAEEKALAAAEEENEAQEIIHGPETEETNESE